ncbi:hypothetical protein B0H13DRAFT_1895400 [Mycena leptocephala]|nr:hypothetical protein B0H13DRAFT_1895400 [Mycena leptocephala]
MSSQQPHPLAAHPHLTFPTYSDLGTGDSFQITDDIIGVYSLHSYYLVLVDWRMGTTIANVSCSSSMQDFSFLSSRSYSVVHLNLRLLEGPGGGEGETLESGRLEIFTFAAEGISSPTHVATLELPELDHSGYIESMQILAGPSCTKPLSGTPFSKSNDNRIFRVGMLLVCPDDAQWCHLFVHHRSLHKYVLDHVREKRTAAMIVPWDQWGPQKSRMLLGEDYFWNRHPSSTRLATALHFGPSALRLDGIFRDTVVTSLPYKSTLRSLDEEYNVFLIDQDRILGINTYERRQMPYTPFKALELLRRIEVFLAGLGSTDTAPNSVGSRIYLPSTH